MKVARFWHRIWMKVPSPDGETWSVPRWGWSSHSPQEAEEHAKQRCEESQRLWSLRSDAGRSAANQKDSASWYDLNSYEVLPAREEILQELCDAQQNVIGLVTRNRYGVLVLNTDRMRIIDVDHPQFSPKKWWHTLFASFASTSQKIAGEKSGYERHLLDLVAKQGNDKYRVYRTHSGWRLILVSAVVQGVDAESVASMKRLSADSHYVRMCLKQKTYRARLTAKPWRIGSPRAPFDYPRSQYAENFFAQWESSYTTAASSWRVAQLIAGSEHQVARELEGMIDLHDRLCQSAQDLPLA